LIVGASGQVGSQIASVLGSDCVLASSRPHGRPNWLRLDLATIAPEEANDLIRVHQLKAIYCVGGMTDVEACESDPDTAVQVNCTGPAALAAAAANRGIPFVYFSTEYIFDGKMGPYTEEAFANPICAYGQSKWLGELAVSRTHPHPLIIRTTVVYGQDPGQKNFLYSLRRALIAGRKFHAPIDQISTPTYNRDLAEAVVKLLNAGTSGVFHVCGPERMSRWEFAIRAANIMGLDTGNITGVPTSELRQQARRPLLAGLSIDKLRSIGNIQMRNLEESIGHWASSPRFEETL
jgi:dTDP-4-dehydrorhamnose reductase